MSDTMGRTLVFGPFRLEPDDRLVTADGTPVHLAPKELAVLRLLAEAGGRVVRKEEIFQQVWPDVAVSDSSLTRCIRAIRAALGERGRQGSYLETLHGRGYRFAAPVAPLRADAEAAPSAPVAVPMRLLVAPLENASRKPEDEFLCDGLTEELIDVLGRRLAPRIGLIARYTAMRCKGQDPTECARSLGVGLVLTGTLERRDEAIRVRIELVRAGDAVQRWSARFDRQADRAVDLAPEIANAVAEYLRSEPLREGEPGAADAAAAARTSRLRARSAYLQGRFLVNLRAEDGLRRALERFHQAAAWEPHFALAHVGIAEAHLMLAYRGFARPLAVAPIVRRALDRAFAVAPELPSALTVLGRLQLQIEWNPASAEVAFRRALELDPRQPDACDHLGSLLNAQGRFEEAITVRGEGLACDPFSPLLRLGVGFSLCCLDRFDEALAWARELTRLEPEFLAGYALHGYAAFRAGERREALALAEEGLHLAAGEPLTVSGCVWVQAACGQRAAASVVAESLAREAEQRNVGAAYLTIAFAGLDDQRALAWLERALAERSMYLPVLGADPRCTSLHGYRRFREVVEAAGGSVQGGARPPSG